MNKQTCIINLLTKEEQSLLCFFEPAGYHTRLQQYLAYPQGFKERTTIPKSRTSLSTTKTFRFTICLWKPTKLQNEERKENT